MNWISRTKTDPRGINKPFANHQAETINQTIGLGHFVTQPAGQNYIMPQATHAGQNNPHPQATAAGESYTLPQATTTGQTVPAHSRRRDIQQD